MESLILQNVRNKHANQNPAHMDRVLWVETNDIINKLTNV